MESLLQEGQLIKYSGSHWDSSIQVLLKRSKRVATQGAPLLSTIQAVATNNPGLVQTAQAIVQKEIPTGEPPADIPVMNRDQAYDYFGTSQYIFYISPQPIPRCLAVLQDGNAR